MNIDVCVTVDFVLRVNNYLLWLKYLRKEKDDEICVKAEKI